MSAETGTAAERFVRGADRQWEELGGGVQRQILGHDETVMMVRVKFEAGAVGALHHHPHRQVTLVESGRFEVEIAGEKQVLGAGDGFFVPPDVEHGVTALEAGVLADVFAPAREDFLNRDVR
ncbi:MAG TPA: cupin domain-containing protein [Longimicrobiaceae bacterium]|nr:cupin domain-containing protein [Longimicrobiaceae bacterium]